MGVSVDKIRIGGSKVRSGCRTCKARRVKCDEAKPGCNRCERIGRVCEGYATPPTARPAKGCRFIHYVGPTVVGVRPRASAYIDLDSRALRSLEFFHHSTALQLKQPFPPDIWTPDLLCLMHSEPAIKHGLIALAALHENYQCGSRSVVANERRVLALEHYGKSIHSIVQLNIRDEEDAVGPTLLTSVLYCAIESLQGHFASALKHIAAGIRLLNEHDDEKQGLQNLPTSLMDTLRQVYVGLCMQATALDANFVPVTSQFVEGSQISNVCSFSTVEEALTEIARMMNDAMRVFTWSHSLPGTSGFPCVELQTARQALIQRYDCWTRIFRHLTLDDSVLTQAEQYRKKSALLVLRVNQLMTGIILAVDPTGLQTGFDSLTNEFEKVVSAAEELIKIESNPEFPTESSHGPMFSLTLGIVPALFSTCVRCRRHQIRHRALAVLKNSQRRESVWDTKIVAMVAEKVIIIEEAAATKHQEDIRRGQSSTVEFCKSDGIQDSAKYLPESARVRELEVDFLESETSAKVSMLNMVGSRRHSQILVWDG